MRYVEEYRPCFDMFAHFVNKMIVNGVEHQGQCFQKY